MDPIKINPLYVSIFLPAPAGSVMEFASQVSGIFTAHPTPDLRVRVESGSPGSHVFVGSAIKNYHLGMVLLQAMYEKNEIVEDF